MIATQYARRDANVDAKRYSLFEAAALRAQLERLDAMLALLRAERWCTLADRSIVEVGCGAGGNLLDMLRLGASPERLCGIELLPERVIAARRCLPAALKIIEGDATTVSIAPSSQDVVIAFTVFSSLLDHTSQDQLAAAIWRWLKPGGGVLWYDFVVDNPRNRDVRGIPMRRLRALFPKARLTARRVTLLPPLARAVGRIHPGLIVPLAACLPFLKTHRLVFALKS
jgi:SAM-dependent methyltransferase